MQNVMLMPTTASTEAPVGGSVFPLALAAGGNQLQVVKIKGNEDTRRFLGGLGFVEGGKASIVNCAAGNLIVEVKGARIALGRQMAQRIMVQPL